MAQATITSKGQVTIPKKIRDKMHLQADDKVYFEETEEGEVKISTPKKSIKDLKGILHRQGQKKVTVDEMNEGIAEYLAKKHRK